MSKLGQLLQELCPDGVKYKKLSEVTIFIKDGTHGSLKDVDNGYPLLSAKDIYDGVVHIPENCRKISAKDFNDIYKNYRLQVGDVLLTIVGTIGRTALVKSESLNIAFQRSVSIIRVNDELRADFLSHLLGTKMVISQLKKGTNQSAQGGIYLTSLGKIRIPVPPLPVQREIVRILDNFTELIAKLTAEQIARKKQYEYYRNMLLTFDVHREGIHDLVWRTLGDFCDLLTGYPFDSSHFKKEGVRLLRGMNIKRSLLEFNPEIDKYWTASEGLERFLLNADDIVIAMDGSLVGKSYGIVKESDLPLLLVQRVTRIRTSKANIRYVYHYIASGAFTSYAEKKKSPGAIPHISLKDISNFAIPLPSLSVQKKIVKILDNFDAICSDIEIGLPAEIEARQKQYEFYRDTLLTFAAADEISIDGQTL